MTWEKTDHEWDGVNSDPPEFPIEPSCRIEWVEEGDFPCIPVHVKE